MAEEFDVKAFLAMRDKELVAREAKRTKPRTILDKPGESHTIETQKFTIVPDAGVSAKGYTDVIKPARMPRPDAIVQKSLNEKLGLEPEV